MCKESRHVPAWVSRRGARSAVAGLVVVLAAAMGSGSAQAQDFCGVPADDYYRDHMDRFDLAMDTGEYDDAATQLAALSPHYSYAVIDYERARMLEASGELAEAAQAYDVFFWNSENCPEMADLRNESQLRRASLQATLGELDSAGDGDGDGDVDGDGDGEGTGDTASNDGSADGDGQTGDDHNRDGGLGLPEILMITGGGIVLVGVVYDLAFVSPLGDDRDAAQAAGDRAEFERVNDDIQTAATIDYLIYGAGLATAAVGLVLWLTEDEAAPSAGTGVSLGARGADVGMTWLVLF